MQQRFGMKTSTTVAWSLSIVFIVGCDDLDQDVRPVAHPSSEARPRGATAYQPCGTPLAQVHGIWAYSNGWQTGSGNSCMGNHPNAVGAYEYQCVEFAQRYMEQRYGIAPIWPVTAAKEMCWSHPAGVSPRWSGYEPVPGDLAVWTDGTWGHVAVVAEVFDGGIRVVEQNASAEGTRVLYGDPWNGYWTDWDTSPGCFMHADAATAPDPSQQPPPVGSTAQCDALGYDGACRGSTSVWAQDGVCLVRDCAAEGRSCGWIADGVGWGCLGGTSGATTFDCADVGYTGACMADDTLVWAEAGACKVVQCPELGKGCGWSDTVGFDCI